MFDWLIIEYEYIISLGTGNKSFGGTDANVFVKICGKNYCSGELQLKGSSTNPFERGDKDVFKVISLVNLGMLHNMRLIWFLCMCIFDVSARGSLRERL